MHRNEVVLVGRLSMEPVHRELPSGAPLTQWRLAVRRPGGRPGHQRSDAIECATFDNSVRDMLTGWQLDDLVEVEGALRRRWWRGGSRYEIEVRTARRIEPAAPRRRRKRRQPGVDDDTAAAGTDETESSETTGAASGAETTVAETVGMSQPADESEAAEPGGLATSSIGDIRPAGLPPTPSGDGAVGSPPASSGDQHDAVPAEHLGERVSQWRRFA
ncbi:single-stranded DNA-binding protein [Microbispora sp. CA-135349]|uniref:single-stranded DNA-binding protein n=1 Tax=Microbispora sp. CA-135349 TaxID=3239953 RepID=UPI003D8EFFE6